MHILVIGAGYVGLVSASCFAEMGNHVICLDIDQEKIDRLSKGQIPIYEPGLEELVGRNLEAKRLEFTTAYAYGVKNSKICFIAVATPSTPDGSCDLTYVENASLQIAKHLSEDKLIVIKSTVPVGTSAFVQKLIREEIEKRSLDLTCDVVSNPEFLKEGAAVNDCLKPDRIILGSNSEEALLKMKELYSSFTLNHEKILCMDPLSAEMTKYAANAMLATRISFMNELSLLCEKLGANIHNVRVGIGSDPRIGYHFLYSGVGYGGSCFPKDIRALQAMAEMQECPMLLLCAVEEVNQNQKKIMAKKIRASFPQEKIKGKTIGIWGLSFKPDTDDMREAPSIDLIGELLSLGANLRLFDPVAMENAKRIFKGQDNITFCRDEYEASENADAIVLMTEWKQFRFVDFERILKSMKGNAFFDGRNQYKPHEMKAKGFDYFGIGVVLRSEPKENFQLANTGENL